MEIKPAGSQPSGKGPAESFTERVTDEQYAAGEHAD